MISRDQGDDQLSEYDDDSSDNDSDDFAVEEDGAIRDMQNEELGFLFASLLPTNGRLWGGALRDDTKNGCEGD